MVLFWTTTLVTSIFALFLLVGIKHYELESGRVVGARMRIHSHRFFHGLSLWIERIIPTLLRMYSKILWRNSASFVHKIIALGIVFVESRLEKLLKRLRRATEVKRGVAETSTFLKEVSEHKRKLLKAQSVQAQIKKEELSV